MAGFVIIPQPDDPARRRHPKPCNASNEGTIVYELSRSLERGQILVIFAGGLCDDPVPSAPLVIDLGFVFMIKRDLQNAADPGVIAAARYIRDPGPGGAAEPTKMRQAACFYAEQNGFFPRCWRQRRWLHHRPTTPRARS